MGTIIPRRRHAFRKAGNDGKRGLWHEDPFLQSGIERGGITRTINILLGEQNPRARRYKWFETRRPFRSISCGTVQ
jgi:hypothetical protein